MGVVLGGPGGSSTLSAKPEEKRTLEHQDYRVTTLSSVSGPPFCLGWSPTFRFKMKIALSSKPYLKTTNQPKDEEKNRLGNRKIMACTSVNSAMAHHHGIIKLNVKNKHKILTYCSYSDFMLLQVY